LGPQPRRAYDTNLDVTDGKTKQGFTYAEFALSSPPSDKGTFRVVKVKEIKQKDAQELCKGEGGNLASIHSAQALNALHDILGSGVIGWTTDVPTVWIGLYSDGAGKPLKWYDGWPVDFKKLPFDFPQSSQAIEGALYIAAAYHGAAYFYDSYFTMDTVLCKLR
jgi:hypothetical protein